MNLPVGGRSSGAYHVPMNPGNPSKMRKYPQGLSHLDCRGEIPKKKEEKGEDGFSKNACLFCINNYRKKKRKKGNEGEK